MTALPSAPSAPAALAAYEPPVPPGCLPLPSPVPPEGGGGGGGGGLDSRSDGELLRSLAAGDRAALAALYDRHVATLLTMAQRLLGTRSDAEDLVHDLFLEVWLRADSYDASRASVRTWLLLRLRSRALDRLKSASYTRNVSLSTSGIDLESLQSPEGSPPEITPSGVQRALGMLAPHEQILLDLAYFRGHSLPEVADYLCLPLGTVKSRLRRLLERLRRNFDKSPR